MLRRNRGGAAACGGEPEATATPSASPSPTPTPTPAITEIPFAAAAFPVDGSACDLDGYDGRLGRVEAVDARTVRFTLRLSQSSFAPFAPLSPARRTIVQRASLLWARSRSARGRA